MIRLLALALLVIGTAVAALLPLPATAQEATIYVDPASGSLDEWFVFDGSGFVPAGEITV
jgi:hypothetical protein